MRLTATGPKPKNRSISSVSYLQFHTPRPACWYFERAIWQGTHISTPSVVSGFLWPVQLRSRASCCGTAAIVIFDLQGNGCRQTTQVRVSLSIIIGSIVDHFSANSLEERFRCV
jgi:hypothetical protein